jgi:hypothetical protein
MSSPFSTFEEFEGAIDGPTGGAIYTFADNPTINTILLLICAGLFVWFVVRTFSTHYEGTPAVDKSLNHLSAFIVAGLLSLVGAEYRQTAQSQQSMDAQPQAMSHRPGAKSALGLLGMVGVGLPVAQSRSRRKGRYRDIQPRR